MRARQRSLRLVALAVCLVQGLLLSAATVVAVVHPEALSVLECTCDHGDEHATCPMHRSQSGNEAECRLQSTRTLGLADMMIVVPGVVPESVTIVARFTSAAVRLRPSSSPRDTFLPPDAPPPRA